MDLLRAVEYILGDVESWPAYIINNLFVVKPDTGSVKKVAVIMYGSGVPIERDIDCFIAYIGLDSYDVSYAMKDRYSIWDKNPYRAHKAEYYSMSLKHWIWINGMALNQQEEVWPQVTYMQLGTENTGCQQIINTTIEHVRSCTPM